MKSRIPNPGTIIAVVALVLALTGTAIAVTKAPKNSVVSKSIKNGQVKTKDLKDNAVKSPKLAANAVDGGKIADGSVGGADLAGGITSQLSGPHAQGVVSDSGQLSRGENATVARESEGVYCVTPGAGIDPATAVMTVSVNGAEPGGTNQGNRTVAIAEWNPVGPSCPDGTLQVDTFLYDGDGTDDNSGGDELDQVDLGFVFEIN